MRPTPVVRLEWERRPRGEGGVELGDLAFLPVSVPSELARDERRGLGAERPRRGRAPQGAADPPHQQVLESPHATEADVSANLRRAEVGALDQGREVLAVPGPIFSG